MKVVAIRPFTGSYPCPAGEVPDYTQTRQVTNDDGTVKNQLVGYKIVRGLVSVTRFASPGDIEDDKRRVANGQPSWLSDDEARPSVTVPGSPPFDLPDHIAKDWITRGLVEPAHVSADQTVRRPSRGVAAASVGAQ